jgi:hypothetical protein
MVLVEMVMGPAARTLRAWRTAPAEMAKAMAPAASPAMVSNPARPARPAVIPTDSLAVSAAAWGEEMVRQVLLAATIPTSPLPAT